MTDATETETATQSRVAVIASYAASATGAIELPQGRD